MAQALGREEPQPHGTLCAPSSSDGTTQMLVGLASQRGLWVSAQDLTLGGRGGSENLLSGGVGTEREEAVPGHASEEPSQFHRNVAMQSSLFIPRKALEFSSRDVTPDAQGS